VFKKFFIILSTSLFISSFALAVYFDGYYGFNIVESDPGYLYVVVGYLYSSFFLAFLLTVQISKIASLLLRFIIFLFISVFAVIPFVVEIFPHNGIVTSFGSIITFIFVFCGIVLFIDMLYKFLYHHFPSPSFDSQFFSKEETHIRSTKIFWIVISWIILVSLNGFVFSLIYPSIPASGPLYDNFSSNWSEATFIAIILVPMIVTDFIHRKQ